MNSLNGVMVVGLTGQTGAGKSTVSRLFTESGFCVIDADQIARAVVHKLWQNRHFKTKRIWN